MPEIWLRYGSTEVVLDIKAENLLEHIAEDGSYLTEEQVNAKFDSINVNGSAHIVVLDSSQYVAKLASMLVNALKKKDITPSINVPADVYSAYRNAFQDIAQVGKFPSEPSFADDTIFISCTSFDPLFGYHGVPTQMLRNFGGEQMLDAYKAREGDVPKPGAANNALSIAHKFAEQYDATSIEVLTWSGGFADIFLDRPMKAHQRAIAALESMGKREVERSRASIISPGNGRSTLSSALNSLWNCMDAMREDGSITLLAECGDGFGSTALERFVEGKIDLDDAHNLAGYVEGLEDLLYLGEMREKYELILVSALPNYYAKSRLGFKTFGKVKDALHHILGAQGQRQKVLVVSDASRLLLKSK
jgi:hypothetical protein